MRRGGNAKKGAEIELVVNDSVYVVWKKLGGGEAAAVESLSFSGGEFDNGDSVSVRSDSVSENRLDQNGRCTELGVLAFPSEEIERRFVIVLSGHARVLCTVSSEPLLHFINQLRPNTFSPALTKKYIFTKSSYKILLLVLLLIILG